jgi:cytochrome c553
MKRLKMPGSFKLGFLVVVFAAAPALGFEADSPNVRNCTWCHAEGGRGYLPAPRLAGQRPQYLDMQLLDFHEHLRDNPFSKQYMWGATAALSPETRRRLAIYFSEQSPQPATDGDRALVTTGRAIYEEGIPESNIVSCVACHGPNAEGVGQIPRLGGLAYSYLKTRLRQWGEGYHASATPMPGIARELSPVQIEALASYLSFVR